MERPKDNAPILVADIETLQRELQELAGGAKQVGANRREAAKECGSVNAK